MDMFSQPVGIHSYPSAVSSIYLAGYDGYVDICRARNVRDPSGRLVPTSAAHSSDHVTIQLNHCALSCRTLTGAEVKVTREREREREAEIERHSKSLS